MPRTLTKPQFDILSELLAPGGAVPQDSAALRELEQLGYIKNGRPTPAGAEAMEPYRVKRAVFLAAGSGSRLAPSTLNTPKPLVRVHGKRIIDTLLDACAKLESDLAAVPFGPERAMRYCHDVLVPDMAAARETADQLEALTDAKAWPFPVYSELLFSV